MRSLWSGAVVVAALSFTVGCARKQVVAEEPVTQKPTTSTPAPVADNIPATQPTETELDIALRDTVLYYGLDDSTLTAESQDKLRHLAEVLRKKPGATVRIAGHCDERGTVEYNLALGHRRAAAARKYLVNLGVQGSTLDTVSFGSERPAVSGNSEAAWSKNRRAEFNTAQR